jgi:hypothetical protein
MDVHGSAGAIWIAIADRLHDVVVLGAVLEVAHPDEHRVVGGQRKTVMQALWDSDARRRLRPLGR